MVKLTRGCLVGLLVTIFVVAFLAGWRLRPIGHRAAPVTVAAGGDWYVNAGSARAYTDAQGRVWQADRAFTAGGWGFTGGLTYTNATPIRRTTDTQLYQTERYWIGDGRYTFTLPNGDYEVWLRFAEIYPQTYVGDRVFDVIIEGRTLETLDLMQQAGRYVAYDIVWRGATVIDGALTVELHSRSGNPKLSAIGVTPHSWPTNTPTPTIVPTRTAEATPTPTGTPTPVVAYSPTPTVQPTAVICPATPTPLQGEIVVRAWYDVEDDGVYEAGAAPVDASVLFMSRGLLPWGESVWTGRAGVVTLTLPAGGYEVSVLSYTLAITLEGLVPAWNMQHDLTVSPGRGYVILAPFRKP
jgi:hypothetical protein